MTNTQRAGRPRRYRAHGERPDQERGCCASGAGTPRSMDLVLIVWGQMLHLFEPFGHGVCDPGPHPHGEGCWKLASSVATGLLARLAGSVLREKKTIAIVSSRGLEYGVRILLLASQQCSRQRCLSQSNNSMPCLNHSSGNRTMM